MTRRGSRQAEYGDFQTPAALAARVCRLLRATQSPPACVVEPTCGHGQLLAAAARAFADARLLGCELDPAHVRRARTLLRSERTRARIERRDFFATDWRVRLARLPGPLLLLGNPPWVTNAQLGALGSRNLPAKAPVPGLRGLSARTGASNFDLSEAIVLHLMEAVAGRPATIAMLLKLSVARRVLRGAHLRGLSLRGASIHRIDARAHFGAAVEAGLLVTQTAPQGEATLDCPVYPDLETRDAETTMGSSEGQWVADMAAYRRAQACMGTADPPWRSGLKHDARDVMELTRRQGVLRNAAGEPVDIEATHVFPLLKGADLAHGRHDGGRRVLVPQRRVGEPTETLASTAPRTWAYLCAHGTRLDARRSRIYAGQPRFSVFGVGPYTFQPWKVCIPGLYRRARFTIVGPVDGKPVVLDDTCYFVGFDDEAQARRAHRLLSSRGARDVIAAFAFWDEKRPIKKAILDRLSLERLEQTLASPAADL